MSGIRDTATVTLNVNGAQAKQMMSDIEQKISDTKKKISDLKANMADPKEIQKARKELKSYEKQLDDIKSATEGVENALNNLDSATPRQLEKALRTLNKQLKDMTPGSETWDSHIEKIKELKERISELKEETCEQESLWDKFMNWSVGAWPALDLLGQWGSGFADLARSAVDAFASMDQEMANVRKFTGLTEEQVVELNEAFKNIDTRTSREDLNKLAQEAGRLGKTSQEDILGFVRAADKINVALDDLGDGATLTLSKLTGIFGDEKIYGTEQSLLKVGSVINELSQNCSASAPYLAEFASRMGGVGSQAGMTIQQVMGFAAVLDSNEQQVEASATALSQVIVRMMQDPAKYAKVAGLEVQTFSNMLKEDANGALIMFLETLQKAGGMDVLSPMFKDMGENGSRAISALSTLATHIEEVKAQQEAANVAFEEGISIDNEFDVQNNTVQAGLEKCAKAAQEIRVELGERLQPLMSHMLSSTSALMRSLLTITNFLIDNKSAVIALTAAITAYLIVINKEIVIKKLRNALDTIHYGYLVLHEKATKALAIVTEGARVVYYRLTGQIEKATIAQKAFKVAMSSMPWAAIITAITAATAVLVTFYLTSRKAKTEAEMLADAHKKIADAEKQAEANCSAEITRLDALYKATQNQAAAMGNRIAAANKMRELYPQVFKDLTNEAILAGDAADAYERLRQSIIRSAQAKARENLLIETESDIEKTKREWKRKLESTLKDVEVSREEIMAAEGDVLRAKQWKVNDSSNHPEYSFTKGVVNTVNSQYQNKLRGLEVERNELGSSVAADALEDASNSPQQNPNPSYPPSGGGNGGGAARDRFATENAWREKEEALARIAYAKGESDYEEYTVKMSQIQVDYNQKLLARDDVSGTERLKIQADYWEATNKYTQSQHAEFVSIENASYEESVRNLNEQYAKKLEAGNLSAEERKAAEKAHEEALELAELEHLKRLTVFTKEGSDERNKAEQQYLDARLKAAKRHQEEYERTQQEHEKRLASFKDKYFGMNASEKKAAYDKDIAALTEVYNAEILAAEDNADEKLRIEKAYQDAKLALQKQYGLLSEEDTRNSMQKAIDSSVEWLSGDGGKALTGTLNTLVSGMSSIFSGLSSFMQAELEIQTAAINKRYDAEIDRAQGNSYRIRTLEKQRDAEQAKAKKEANRKMFALQVIQAVAQTAQNALNAYGSAAAVPVVGYILAPIAAAMAVAAGAIQIATIKKQQQASESQGFSKGGFTKPGAVDEPAGIVHAGEWVASQKLLANPVARPMIEALDYAQRTNTIGSIKDEDVSRSIRASDSMVRIAESNDSYALMVAAIAHNAEAMSSLNERLKYPIDAAVSIAGDHGVAQAEDKYKMYLKNKSPKNF
ncbi:MAG: phage tail tape measure protein [Muribaculaceae bacterium]|nr:phage tail tape measure protein [Muribaculaceae bacterium]